jgi:hypothetical protein
VDAAREAGPPDRDELGETRNSRFAAAADSEGTGGGTLSAWKYGSTVSKPSVVSVGMPAGRTVNSSLTCMRHTGQRSGGACAVNTTRQMMHRLKCPQGTKATRRAPAAQMIQASEVEDIHPAGGDECNGRRKGFCSSKVSLMCGRTRLSPHGQRAAQPARRRPRAEPATSVQALEACISQGRAETSTDRIIPKDEDQTPWRPSECARLCGGRAGRGPL